MREYIKTTETSNGPSSQTLPCFTLPDHLVLGFLTQMGRCFGAPDPPGGTCKKEAALYTDATTYVAHVPSKEGGQLLQSTDHLFSSSPLFLEPPRPLRLPVKSITVKHGRGITSTGGYKSEVEALDCHRHNHLCLLSFKGTCTAPQPKQTFQLWGTRFRCNQAGQWPAKFTLEKILLLTAITNCNPTDQLWTSLNPLSP